MEKRQGWDDMKLYKYDGGEGRRRKKTRNGRGNNRTKEIGVFKEEEGKKKMKLESGYNMEETDNDWENEYERTKECIY